MYTIITHGYTLNPKTGIPECPANIDPPSETIRISLVVTLLVTCGRYFSRGSAKRKLHKYLVYFQRYLLSKPSILIDLEFMVDDMVERVAPDVEKFSTLEEVQKKIKEMEDASGGMYG